MKHTHTHTYNEKCSQHVNSLFLMFLSIHRFATRYHGNIDSALHSRRSAMHVVLSHTHIPSQLLELYETHSCIRVQHHNNTQIHAEDHHQKRPRAYLASPSFSLPMRPVARTLQLVLTGALFLREERVCSGVTQLVRCCTDTLAHSPWLLSRTLRALNALQSALSARFE